MTRRDARRHQPERADDNNAITVNRYRVVYRRSDGRNTPGVDVPYAFDGARRPSRSARATTSPIPFVLVRVQAKLEAPLVDSCAGGGGRASSSRRSPT